MDGPVGPAALKRNQALLWSGVGAILVGALLLLYGAWPLGYTFELLKGPGGDPEAVEGNVEEMMGEAKARVWADALGFVLLLAGTVMVPASKPKPRPVEELVEEALQRRASAMPPSPKPAAPSAAPVAEAPLPRCPTCGSLLVAGGRICPKGHA